MSQQVINDGLPSNKVKKKGRHRELDTENKKHIICVMMTEVFV